MSRKKRNAPRLTPTIKKGIARAVELVQQRWIQGDWMKDAETGESYAHGWFENGEKPAVCAVGGLERAAWELCGKPDMSNEWTLEARKVQDLVSIMERRVNAFIDLKGLELEGYEIGHSIMSVNDDLPERIAKKTVIETMRKAANLV